MKDYAELEKRLRARASARTTLGHGKVDSVTASLLHEAADALSALSAAKADANNQWRLDYNEMAGNAELFQETVISLLRPYAPRRSLLDLSGQRIADFLCRYAPAYAQEHGLSREHALERQLPRDPLADNPTDSDENAP